MKRVIIESPFGSKSEDPAEREKERQANIDYARRCLKDSLDRGEAPICSHLLIPQVLDDDIPEEREQGMRAGHAWIRVADLVVFYLDHGMSDGMEDAYEAAKSMNMPMVERYLDK